jgi:mannopine transport system permease protein
MPSETVRAPTQRSISAAARVTLSSPHLISRSRRSLPIARISLLIVVALVLVFLILPTVLVVPMSLGSAAYIEFPPRGLTLRWYANYFHDPEWVAATLFSLKTALVTMIVATGIGTLASLALVRGRLPCKSFIHALTLSPMIVPHIVFAVALYLVFAPLRLTGNLIGFVIAHTLLALPYVVITVSAALQRFDTSLELAALSCGATRLRAFFHVVLPNIAPGVAAGAVFAFLTSFDEATVSFFISGLDGRPLTRKMFEDIDFNVTPVVAAVSTVLVIVSLAMMGGVQLLRSKVKV